MRQRTGTLVLVVALLAAPLITEAQQTGKVYRIGFLTIARTSAGAHVRDTLRHGLRDRGYVEGQNIVIEYRFAEGQRDRLPDLAAELVRLKVDIIVAARHPAALAASKATGTIPIVFVNVAAPVEIGLVASLARPGGNLTGMAFDVTPEANAKRLELLKQVAPKVSRVAVLREGITPANLLYWNALERVAQALAVKLEPVDVRYPDEFDTAFAEIIRNRPDALHVWAGPMGFSYRDRIVEFSLKNRLLTECGFRESVEAGCLMSYGTSIAAPYRRAATFIDKILKGAKPGDLPVEQPTTFEFIVNLKTAKVLGLTIPPSLLLRADHIIE